VEVDLDVHQTISVTCPYCEKGVKLEIKPITFYRTPDSQLRTKRIKNFLSSIFLSTVALFLLAISWKFEVIMAKYVNIWIKNHEWDIFYSDNILPAYKHVGWMFLVVTALLFAFFGIRRLKRVINPELERHEFGLRPSVKVPSLSHSVEFYYPRDPCIGEDMEEYRRGVRCWAASIWEDIKRRSRLYGGI
jgi:hypothetical protein